MTSARTLVMVAETPAITEAIEGGDADALSRLLAEHPGIVTATPYGDHGSLLHLAAESGHSHVVSLLLDGDADTGLIDEDGQTALHVAAANGHPEAVSALMQRSQAVSGGTECKELAMDDNYQMTPFHL